MKINRQAIVGLCIATAFHQRGWCPGTRLDECYQDFRGIATQAYGNLEWAGIDNVAIFDHDIAQAIWGLDREEFEHELENM